MLFLSFLLTSLACLLAIPIFVFSLEILAGFVTRKADPTTYLNDTQRKRIAIVVPAHNESAGINSTLNNLKLQLLAGDRLLVVADNCTDDTAFVAAQAGAEVIVRNNPERVGKGYALDFAIRHLGLVPPEIVIFVDADCTATGGAVDALIQACARTNRPVQALYLMKAPEGSPINYQVAEFAWRVKNWVRPLGLLALQLPCQLTGTGMAFPWNIIRTADLAHGSTVEDMKLGLEMARTGAAPLFCPAAKVTSYFPWSTAGAKSQRKRWEEGHLRTITTAIPHLLCTAIWQRNFPLFAVALDLLVPPLSLLVLLLIGMSLVTGVAFAFGMPAMALTIGVASFSLFGASLFLTWIRYGRDVLPLASVPEIGTYVLAKLPLYGQMLTHRATPKWKRTDRGRLE